MHPKLYPNFSLVIDQIQEGIRHRSVPVHTEKWQGMEIQDKPEMATYELMNLAFQVQINPRATLKDWQEDIKPNIPWADNHFEERVSGYPLNPGTEWANWPYGKSADRFRDDERFNHTYAERYWPKYARKVGPNKSRQDIPDGLTPHTGILYDYGDLRDVVNLLKAQPLTRQAYLPVFFPEDTGVVHGGRVPCTLGYHFMRRGDHLHVNYYLRSCDFVRHFRDDIYLTLRLLLWMIEEISDPNLKPGFLGMYITSMHLFKNDYRVIFKDAHPRDNV